MPITYDEKENLWNTSDLTPAEKESLLNIAKEEIVGFFGQQVASQLLALAKQASGGKIEIVAGDEVEEEETGNEGVVSKSQEKRLAVQKGEVNLEDLDKGDMFNA